MFEKCALCVWNWKYKISFKSAPPRYQNKTNNKKPHGIDPNPSACLLLKLWFLWYFSLTWETCFFTIIFSFATQVLSQARLKMCLFSLSRSNQQNSKLRHFNMTLYLYMVHRNHFNTIAKERVKKKLHLQAAQRSCGCRSSVAIHIQVGWVLGQPDLLSDLVVGNPFSSKENPNHSVLWKV